MHAAERETSAEFAVVVARTSDGYGAVTLACGLTLGSLVALGLWHEAIFANYPQLMMVQLVVCVLTLTVPYFRHQCLRLAPRHFLMHRAAQRAAAEYLRLTHRLPASAPVILLYVSLAERYVHIYASRFVREKIPDSEWDAVVETLTESVQEDGVCDAVMKAVDHAAKMLKAVFPETGIKHSFPNVIEIID